MSEHVIFEGRPWFESSPPIPQHGGTLDFNGNGIAGCARCGWRGAPTWTGGEQTPKGMVLGFLLRTVTGAVRSTVCPACEAEPYRLAGRVTAKVGRNDPCPCASGRKFKKCHGGPA